MTLRDQLEEKISQALEEIAGSFGVPAFSLEVPEVVEYGDYATNVALLLAKPLERNPMEIAQELAKTLVDDRWGVSVAAPGFLNFTFTDKTLVSALEEVFTAGEAWGTSNVGEGKTVMVEYFQLNIAKRPHIGHVRSAVIGDALKRMFLSQGYHAVSDTHVGDWGTQFGILLLGYKDFQLSNEKKEIQEDPFAFLEDIYMKENAKIEADPDRRELAKQEFAKLERGDTENRKIWEWMVDVSMKKLEESAERLGLLPFDEHKGESSYEADMPHIVEEALKKDIVVHKEDGAILVDLTKEKLDEAVLIKSDGASTYLLRDLATIKYRQEKWVFWKNIYVVDVRQSHHFRQLFRVAELLGYEGVGTSEHVEFGFMKLPEGAISTRKGTAIALDALLDEAEKRALAVIREKNPDLPHVDEVAKQVGMGAVKYFDLSHNRKSDIMFEWEKVLSFEGNTGPYIQYTHARLKSILRKGGFDLEAELPFGSSASQVSVLEDLEHKLIVIVLRFPDAISEAITIRSPHVLAAYLYELASIANEFYHTVSVLQEKDEQKRALRAVIVTVTATTLHNGLELLGIEAPEEM
ncbi:MAG: arginine--tRNA ligase [Candidatus Ryanbacteria bacterium RIFCSPHIGHO2_02_FULL_45_13b]|uniref:Arginine--tRNA ligase n=1 Tax=Candidatus Ryanbacteria bacterium RIFCSPHIGHO2_02_FULL_45_13b TaxID=1802117 RepID=A0A1G2GAL5_9BACT|nr:MAG: arginine--tRNA ligase [Candidatus Ryanbacteria bacterium RIFCSPHIGHO2_02_FULL_45_13b]